MLLLPSFFFSSRRRHTRSLCDWSSDVCSSDLVAAGIAFGAAAVLTKGVVHYLGDGVFAWIPHWEPYALALASIGGVIIGQSAFQTGALAASVGSTESTAPIAAAILGLLLLDESVFFDSPDQVAAVMVSICMILIGIAALARAEERVIADAAATT